MCTKRHYDAVVCAVYNVYGPTYILLMFSIIFRMKKIVCDSDSDVLILQICVCLCIRKIGSVEKDFEIPAFLQKIGWQKNRFFLSINLM